MKDRNFKLSKRVNKLKCDQTNERKDGVIERKRSGTNNKPAAVAQQGCQVQSGVGRQDRQGAATRGESWETCVSCLLCLQTTSLCFTGPFFPSTHCQRLPSSSTLHHPKKKTKKKMGYLHLHAEKGFQTGRSGGEAGMNEMYIETMRIKRQ